MMDDLLEELSELEHEQWMWWTKELCKKESIPQYIQNRWRKSWIPYSELTEEMKEHDRVWARKVLKIMKREEDNV